MDTNSEVLNFLLKMGFINQSQVEAVRNKIMLTGLPAMQVLGKMGIVTEEQFLSLRADSLGITYMDLTDYLIDVALVKLIPESFVKKNKVVPLFKTGNTLTVGMVNPENVDLIHQIRRMTKLDYIEPVLVSEEGIQRVLESYYTFSGGSSLDELLSSIEKGPSESEEALAEDGSPVEAPVIKIVNMMIIQAVKERTSDIHVEPEEKMVRIRFRVDGVLHEVNQLPKNLQTAIISRVKVLANLDIAENRRPQDGRIRFRFESRDLDIRVSTFPTIHGENVVMRILDQSALVLELKDVGFGEKEMSVFNQLIQASYGMILVTGPTGSGKTTTLYSALSTVNSATKKIVTIEDPVEYQLPMVRQTHVNPKADLTFANGLRNILRQDPDIIMVGEIRDKETAEVAVQASLTGHLVFSTLHTNDSASTLNRMMDMGVEPFLISSSVIGILAQRLVRTICSKCKEPYQAPKELVHSLPLQKNAVFYRGKGCARCGQSGFYGRIGIFELLVVTEDIRRMVNEKRSAEEIKKKAIEQGMRTLRQSGFEKVAEGLTTFEEVFEATEVR